MREVDGRLIYDTLPELVGTDHTAMLLIDLQNDFCSEQGTYAANGYDVSMYGAMLPSVQRLLREARAQGILRIFIQNTTLPGHLSDSPAQVRFRVRLSRDPDAVSLRYTEDESWGHEFVPAVAPEPGEVVLKKFRSSAFVGTPLDLLLRANGIDTILVCGCTTEGCVESTARDGMFMDYYVVVVPDCIESDTREQHEASLTLMRNRFDMFSSTEIMAAWGSPAEHEVAG